MDAACSIMRVLIATVCLLLIAVPATAESPLREVQNGEPLQAMRNEGRTLSRAAAQDPAGFADDMVLGGGAIDVGLRGPTYACWTTHWATTEYSNGYDVARTGCDIFYEPEPGADGFSAERLVQDIVDWAWELIFG